MCCKRQSRTCAGYDRLLRNVSVIAKRQPHFLHKNSGVFARALSGRRRIRTFVRAHRTPRGARRILHTFPG